MKQPVPATVAAIDLGASSGRVLVARVGAGQLDLSEVRRFANEPVLAGEWLHWDTAGIYRNVIHGLRAAGREFGRLDSVGVDSWAIDYGLLDASGALIVEPTHYRDRRTAGVMQRVLETVPAAEIYESSGIQFLPFNTIYQVVSAKQSPELAAAATLLLIPDLITFWLTGHAGAEITNASTTQLLDISSGTWATGLMERLGIDTRLFPPLRSPGTRAGLVTPEVLQQAELTGPLAVTTVGSHDTASAVVAVPASKVSFGYISCGTWSLVGLELDRPVLTDASREANFTNELGVDGTVRFLRNVMGLWLLQESMRTWRAHGLPTDLDQLLADAVRVTAFGSIVDPNDPMFLEPGDMPTRIVAACEQRGEAPPTTQGEIVRCIMDSLALAHRSTMQQAQELTGRAVEVLHIVGGGARNPLLCQLTADACGVPVVAGPVEATAIGNALVQARALGAASGSLHDLRQLVAHAVPLHHYEPQTAQGPWLAAARRMS